MSKRVNPYLMRTKARSFHNLAPRARFKKDGYRSGLEAHIARQLELSQVTFEYESQKINFVQPEKKRTYTPDFVLRGPKKIIYIEAKGLLELGDRQKHEWIKSQHPDLDIRFVFSDSSKRIRKGSKTTYADWCIKQGFLYSDKSIPRKWIKEVSDAT